MMMESIEYAILLPSCSDAHDDSQLIVSLTSLCIQYLIVQDRSVVR